MAQFREAEAEEFFSVDLVSSARAHIDFLRRVHAAGLSQRRASAESVRRYRDLWLPLLASRGAAALAAAEDAVPPLDVAWLWHCHRLAPRAAWGRARGLPLPLRRLGTRARRDEIGESLLGIRLPRRQRGSRPMARAWERDAL